MSTNPKILYVKQIRRPDGLIYQVTQRYLLDLVDPLSRYDRLNDQRLLCRESVLASQIEYQTPYDSVFVFSGTSNNVFAVREDENVFCVKLGDIGDSMSIHRVDNPVVDPNATSDDRYEGPFLDVILDTIIFRQATECDD